MSKSKNNTLLYVGIGGVALLLLMKNKAAAAPLLPVGTTLLPAGGTLSTGVNSPAASTNPLTLLGNTIAALIKGSGSTTPATTPVSSNSGSGVDGSNYFNLPPLQSAPLQNYGTPYDPFANAPSTDLTGFDTTCTDCFETTDDSISGVGIGLAAPVSTIKPAATVTSIIQTLALPETSSAGVKPVSLVNPVTPQTGQSCAPGSTGCGSANTLNNSIKFSMPYDGSTYACCCNKGALVAGMVMEGM